MYFILHEVKFIIIFISGINIFLILNIVLVLKEIN